MCSIVLAQRMIRYALVTWTSDVSAGAGVASLPRVSRRGEGGPAPVTNRKLTAFWLQASVGAQDSTLQ